MTGKLVSRQEWKTAIGINALWTRRDDRAPLPALFSEKGAKEVLRFHRSLRSYRKTPLVRLRALASKLGVSEIFVKDESKRFGLNAFKGLGGTWAMFRIICEKLGLDPGSTTPDDLQKGELRKAVEAMTFVTATDGNHGRGISYAGGLFGCHVHVYMPRGTVEERAEAIRRVGPAEVLVTDLNYDDTVRLAKRKSDENGWFLIQDTSWDGFEKVPTWIIQGYLTMAKEALDEMTDVAGAPTHVFLQAGVGSMAGGVAAYLAAVLPEKPVISVVEPTTVACVYESAKAEDGRSCSIPGAPETIMAGLNCGTPCSVVWPILRDYCEFFFACPDYVTAHGMRLYANPLPGDEGIVSGESGAVTMGLLDLVLRRPELAEVKEQMGLGPGSRVLLISTEGNTNKAGYREIVREGAFPLPF